MIERDGERTLYRINTPTKLFGIAPIEFILMIAIILLPMLLSVYTLVVSIPSMLFVVKKLSRATKNGCPDYISEISNSLNVKTSFEDKDQVMKKLK